MRTMTTVNWVREKLTTASGQPLGTVHSGSRGSWTFRITTPKDGTPRLRGLHDDGRQVSQDHRSLRAAKNAAMELLHPSEAMGWTGETGQIQYRAQWDGLVFVVFEAAAETLAFQWRNTETDFRSEAVPVSGVREAREMAAAVLRQHYPTGTPADAPQGADGVSLVALASALKIAGISFTDEQLALAAGAMLHGL